MSAESDFLSAEATNILKTAAMVQDLLGKEDLTPYEVIALGKLLQDAYTGIERVLRTLLEQEGIRVKKSESWHKELLLAAREHSMVSESELGAFSKLLVFRHMEIHGYGFMLEADRLRQLAEPVPDLCRAFLQRLP